MRPHPHEDMSLSDRTGERWADIPSYIGYYMASNLGRVKSLDRYVPHPRHIKQFVKGRVLKQKVHVNPYTLDNDGVPTVDLSVCLMKDNIPAYHNVRRLIWSAFRGEIDFRQDRKVVVNLDTDGYNNKLSNLRLWTERKKSQRSADRGRVTDFLSWADRSKWKIVTNNKPMGKYSLRTGRLLKKYPSVTAAAKGTGFDEKGIISCAKGRCPQWRGFLWRYL